MMVHLKFHIMKHNRHYIGWPESELSLWDLVPEEERECIPGFAHLISRGMVEDQVFIRQVCSRPWCSPCESHRTWRLQQKIKRYLDYHKPDKVYLVTKSVRNDHSLKRAFDDLHAANDRFRLYATRALYDPRVPVVCWIATYEITYSLETGYNLHQHALMGTAGFEQLDYAEWHRLWDMASMHGHAHLNFVPVWHRDRAAVYISKYIAKGCWGGLSRGRAYMVRSTLFGRNRIISKHGTAVDIRLPRYFICCIPPDKTQCVGDGWDTTDDFDERGDSVNVL